ncbi:Nlrc5 [Symbiodinium natans]|uniref:Nlrc5 protein n=1 Tax=Symbiodinium natans TaxID=878477 RepID=A0A812HZF8_9DINO|nr:Nlrc5 [Symbiodinium natans]
MEAARRSEDPSSMPAVFDEAPSSGQEGPRLEGPLDSLHAQPATGPSADPAAEEMQPEAEAAQESVQGPPAWQVPKGIRVKDVCALVEENRAWMEEPTERKGLTGRKNMYDVCGNLIIVKCTSSERVVELSEEDVEQITRSLRKDATESIFEGGTLQCREGVHLGGVPVEHMTIQGILCEGGDLRVKYWKSGDERHDMWMTAEKHGRVQGMDAIPEKLRGFNLGEVNARRHKDRLRAAGTVVVLRTGVAYVDVTEQGKFAPLAGFVSHYWGQETIEFSEILLRHAQKVYPEDPGEMCYYVCTFSNNQHSVDLGGDDLAHSPFNMALEYIASCYRARQESMYGAVMMFDKACAPLTRIWCIYEIFRCHSLGLTLDLFSCEGQICRTSESELMNEIIERLRNLNLQEVGSSEPQDKLNIEAAISDHPGGATAVAGKVQLQVMDLVTFSGCLSITRNAFTGKQVEPEEIELKDLSTGEVKTSNALIQACIEGGLPRILLIGPGGSGKTVFAREVVRRVVDWARRDAGIIPVRVPLAELALHTKDLTGDPLRRWAERAFGAESRELFRGDRKLLLVLDGFDEAGAARRRIVDWLQGWLEAHSCRYVGLIMTSRPSGTDQVLEADGVVRDAVPIPVFAQLSATCFVTRDQLPERSRVELRGSSVGLTTRLMASVAQGFLLHRFVFKRSEVDNLPEVDLQPGTHRVKVRRKDPRQIFSAAVTLQGPADAARVRGGLLEQALRDAGGEPSRSYKVGVVCGERLRILNEDLSALDGLRQCFPCDVYLCQTSDSEPRDIEEKSEDVDVTVQAIGDSHVILTGSLKVGDVLVLNGENKERSYMLWPPRSCFILTMDTAVTECPTELTQITAQTELSTGLGFQPLELLPLTELAATRIAKCREDELRTLPGEVWQTPLMASLLCKYREEHEELPAAGAVAELELMRFAVEALLAQAAQRTGSSGLREMLRPVCLRVLKAGQRLLREADFAGKEVLFQEALRGHLSFFEPAAGHDAVQIYHLRMHELLAAEAWRDSQPPAQDRQGWKNAFGEVQAQPMLRGALCYVLMMAMPEMAQMPELQIDLSELQHPLAAAELEILCRGLQTCLQPRSEKLLLHLLEGSSIGLEGARGLGAALRRFGQLRELDLGLREAEAGLGAEEAAALAGGLARLQELTQLKLGLYRNDQLGAEGWRSLAEALGGLPKLAALELGLGHCKLGAEEASALAGGLARLQELTQLKLGLYRNDQLGAEGWRSLAEALGGLPKLAALELGLGHCKLGAEEAAALASGLARLQELTQLKLDLGGNEELGLGRSLAEALGGLPKLAALELGLGRCKLGAEDAAAQAAALAGALARLQELTQLKLDLGGNDELGLQGGLALAGALRRLPALAKLDADFRTLYPCEGVEEKAELRAALEALPVAEKTIKV